MTVFAILLSQFRCSMPKTPLIGSVDSKKQHILLEILNADAEDRVKKLDQFQSTKGRQQSM